MAEFDRDEVFAGHRIEEVIGRGGMGVVYRAVDLSLEREVALKLIAEHLAADETFRERFKRESRLSAGLRSAHAITVYRADEAEGRLFISMELIRGRDLRELVELEGRLDPARAVRLLGQVGDALEEAHDLGLVHRDVKPHNVLVEQRRAAEHAYLTDFGLSRRISSQSHLTQTGVFLGTPHYAAPEQFRGGTIDHRTDVYAMGCVLYHAVVGDVPYPRETPEAVFLAHVMDTPPVAREKRPELPSALDEVIRRATAKDPAERFASVRELCDAASAAVDEAPAAQPTLSASMTRPAADTPRRDRRVEGEAPTRVETGEDDDRTAGDSWLAPRSRTGAGRSGSAPRRGLAIAAAVLLTVVAVVVVAVSAGGDDAPAPPTPTAAESPTPDEPRLPSGQPIDVGGRPYGVAVGEDDVWVSDVGGDRVVRVDAETRKVVGEPIAVGKEPAGIAVAKGSVWVANSGDNTVSRIDAGGDGPRATSIPVGGSASELAAGGGFVWVLQPTHGLTRIDAESGDIGSRVLTLRPDGRVKMTDVAVGAGQVWATSVGTGSAGRGELLRFTLSGRRKGPPIELIGKPYAIAVDERYAWVVIGGFSPRVVRVDADTGQIVGRSIPIPDGSRDIAVGAGAAWVAADVGTLTRLDAATGEDEGATDVGSKPRSVAVGADAVWVANTGDATVVRVPTSD